MSYQVSSDYFHSQSDDCDPYVQVNVSEIDGDGETGAQIDGWIKSVNARFAKAIKEKGVTKEPSVGISSFALTFEVDTTPKIDELGQFAIEDLFEEAIRDAVDSNEIVEEIEKGEPNTRGELTDEQVLSLKKTKVLT